MKRWQLKGGTPFVYAGSYVRCVAIEIGFEDAVIRKKHRTERDGEVPQLWHVNDLGFVTSITADTEVRVEPYQRRET